MSLVSLVELLLITVMLALAGVFISPIGTIHDALSKEGTAEYVNQRVSFIHLCSLWIVLILGIGSFLIDCLLTLLWYDQESLRYLVPVFINVASIVIGWFGSLRIAGVQITLHPTIIVAPKPTPTKSPTS